MRERFARALTRLCVVFDRDPDEVLLGAYWDALGDLPIDLLEDACREAVRTRKWIPRPVELREIVFPTEHHEAAAAAWPVVLEAIVDAEYGWRMAIEDPVTVEALRSIGGIDRLREMSEEERNHAGRRRFEAVYVCESSLRDAYRRLGYESPDAVPAAKQITGGVDGGGES